MPRHTSFSSQDFEAGTLGSNLTEALNEYALQATQRSAPAYDSHDKGQATHIQRASAIVFFLTLHSQTLYNQLLFSGCYAKRYETVVFYQVAMPNVIKPHAFANVAMRKGITQMVFVGCDAKRYQTIDCFS